jgi:hypothetical protein
MSKHPITAETLQALSDSEFTTVLELAGAEDLRRLTATPVSLPDAWSAHPYFVLTPEDAKEIELCRLAVKHAGMPMYDFLITDRNGRIVSVRRWGQNGSVA